jgi:hypothetical protein
MIREEIWNMLMSYTQEDVILGIVLLALEGTIINTKDKLMQNRYKDGGRNDSCHYNYETPRQHFRNIIIHTNDQYVFSGKYGVYAFYWSNVDKKPFIFYESHPNEILEL